MAIHSNIGEVLENNIKDEKLLNSVKGKFHAVEVEVDSILNEENTNENKALKRAKELIGYIFGYNWINENWRKIEHDIKKEIEASKR